MLFLCIWNRLMYPVRQLSSLLLARLGYFTKRPISRYTQRCVSIFSRGPLLRPYWPLLLVGWQVHQRAVHRLIWPAHPELVDHSKVLRDQVHQRNSRSTGACKAQIEARRQASVAKREAKAHERREARGLAGSHALSDRSIYKTIQNNTCILAPETVWGPYGIDNELHRHDVRESQSGVNLYLDIGVIDVETCEPLPDAWLTIWVCVVTIWDFETIICR